MSPYDVFLCHNSHDKPAVKRIGKELRRRGLKPWLDEWELQPGLPWQRTLEAQIRTIGAAAVFVGASGLGPWQDLEIEGFLRQFIKRQCPVIPVLLPDGQDAPQLPVLLEGMIWVDFRDSEPDPFEQLVWGITGQKGPVEEDPSANPEPDYPDDATRELSQALEKAYQREAELTQTGGDTQEVRQAILELRRRLREGGQLKAGDFLHKGRFQLLEPVGQGGFAKVWKAYDLKRRQLVAIKVLHGQYAEDRTRRERFFRGARKMAELQHQGIVRVVEAELEEGGYSFFVMEYLGGGDLHQAVLNGELVGTQGLRTVCQVAESLDFAHKKGVVHRDVKPANILLDEDGTPKLTDFDLVRAVDTTGGTRTGSMLGTFLYMAPEALESAKETDPRADVFSLAMTAAFAASGQELPRSVLRDPDSFLAGLECPEAAKQALRKGAAWEPEERFSTAGGLATALEAGLSQVWEEEEVEPRPDPAPSPVSPSDLEELFGWIPTPQDGRVPLWREIPAERFLMGSPEGEVGRHHDEGPQHEVRIVSPFRMAVVPVTNAQYLAFQPGHRPRAWEGVSQDELAYHPVVDVTWREAVGFCRWLSESFPWAQGARLPTEEEWEYACRAGSETRYWSGDKEQDLARVGWYFRNSDRRTHRVGEKEANPWGLYDVHGNVWEWTQGWWPNPYSDRQGGLEIDPSKVAAADPAATGGARVIRGGSFRVTAFGARSAFRVHWVPGDRGRSQGFRVCLPAAPSS